MEEKDGLQKSAYPLRPNELVSQSDFLADVEPLDLSEGERKKLVVFEEPLFEEVKRLKGISTSTHVIYPKAFTDEKGSRIFAQIYLGRETQDGEVFSEQEIMEGFLGADLANIPVKSRKKGNRYSSVWAKEQFARAFQETEGDVEEIPNPERITRIVDPDKLVEKLQGLRGFKRQLKAAVKKHDGEEVVLKKPKEESLVFIDDTLMC
jgi:hypothetical protein